MIDGFLGKSSLASIRNEEYACSSRPDPVAPMKTVIAMILMGTIQVLRPHMGLKDVGERYALPMAGDDCRSDRRNANRLRSPRERSPSVNVNLVQFNLSSSSGSGVVVTHEDRCFGLSKQSIEGRTSGEAVLRGPLIVGLSFGLSQVSVQVGSRLKQPAGLSRCRERQ
jgi:hypothetical protein